MIFIQVPQWFQSQHRKNFDHRSSEVHPQYAASLTNKTWPKSVVPF